MKPFKRFCELKFCVFRFYVKEGDTSLVSGCDSACSLDLLCSIVSNEFGDTRKCDEITAVFNGN